MRVHNPSLIQKDAEIFDALVNMIPTQKYNDLIRAANEREDAKAPLMQKFLDSFVVLLVLLYITWLLNSEENGIWRGSWITLRDFTKFFRPSEKKRLENEALQYDSAVLKQQVVSAWIYLLRQIQRLNQNTEFSLDPNYLATQTELDIFWACIKGGGAFYLNDDEATRASQTFIDALEARLESQPEGVGLHAELFLKKNGNKYVLLT